MNNKIGRPKETSMCDNKVEAGLDYSEASDVRENSDEEEDADSAMKGHGNDLRVVDKIPNVERKASNLNNV